MAKPIVAIAGRPNVGKSTLFNRIVGAPLAIVEDLPGTTRDRVYGDAEWRGEGFTVVDTGGLELEEGQEMARLVRAQVDLALAEADLILFLVDCRDGVTLPDQDIAENLRRTAKPVLLVAAKADNARLRVEAAQFYELGLGQPHPVSAIQGTGVGDLLDEVVAHLPPETPEEAPGLRVALVGRPNVGKSMLLNAILGQERAIVSERPGTTRDALDSLYQQDGQTILFIDTAGVRRRGRIEGGVERYSVLRALRAMGRADLVVLLMDATEFLVAQDLHVAGYAFEAFKGTVLVVNKWDLAPSLGLTTKECTQAIRERMKFLDFAPIVFTSALTGEGVDELLSNIEAVGRERWRQVPPEELREVFHQALVAQPPPRHGTKQLRLYRVAQTGTNPPTFTFAANEAALVHFSYRRYWENRLRRAFGFAGTPLRLVFEERPS